MHIYTPSFPFQATLSSPELVISLDKSGPGHPGFIDHGNPHAVNHLIVGELGDEEVLLCACDDGDVIGYTVRSIVRHIEEAKFEEKKPFKTALSKPLIPFLLHNVGKSAWGLAIHGAARMVAVSANTHKITIFAFALERPEQSDESYSQPDDFLEEPACFSKESGLPDRTLNNLIIQLSGHSNNIPNIAFCNLPCDSIGRYLLSTDIDGMVILWDIWNRDILQWHTPKEPVILFSKYVQPESHELQSTDDFSAAWAVMFVDPRCFRHAETEQQLYGCKPTKLRNNGICLTTEKSHVRDASRYHPSIPNRESTWLHPTDQDEGAQSLTQMPRLRRARQQTNNTGGNHQAPLAFEDTSISEQENTASISDEGEVGEDDEDDEGTDDDIAAETTILLEENARVMAESNRQQAERERIQRTIFGDLQEEEDDWGIDEPGEGSEVEGEAEVDGISPLIYQIARERFLRTSKLYKPQFRPFHSGPFPFSILYTTKQEIHLRPNAFSDSYTTYFSNPLVQFLPPELSYLERIDRLNLYAHIPELGLVILGSQVGRVGILALTQDGRPGHRGKCGMRLEWILPFKSQEHAGIRPNVPLIGLAVGPVQGFEGSFSALPGSKDTSSMGRRFRILLTYSDNSILAYEVWRGSEEKRDGKDILVF